MASRTLEPEIQYATLSQQGETAQLGMWVFIATETLFFGALIFTYSSTVSPIQRIRRGGKGRRPVVRERQHRDPADQQLDNGALNRCSR